MESGQEMGSNTSVFVELEEQYFTYMNFFAVAIRLVSLRILVSSSDLVS